MKAFILAGGEGTRLRPYTYTIPKPMLPLGGKPLLQYVIENLRRAGIKELIITAGYRHEQIESYFGNGSDFGVKIEYSIEKEKLNTAGSVLPLKSKVKETFVVVMGDHLTDIDMKKMVEHHRKSGCIATIGLYHSKLPLEYGVVDLKGQNVVGFREKPVMENNLNTAIYVFEPAIFDYIGEKEDFAKNVFPRLLEKGQKISGYVFEGVWYDIGRVSDYERFVETFNITKLMQGK